MKILKNTDSLKSADSTEPKSAKPNLETNQENNLDNTLDQSDQSITDQNFWFYRAERQRLIEVTAYRLAEQGGFCSDPLEYWLIAENEVGGLTP